MPWSPQDAQAKTKKASTPRLQRQWAHVADEELARTGNEATAVKAANGVIAKETEHHRPGQHEFSAGEERRMRESSRSHR